MPPAMEKNEINEIGTSRYSCYGMSLIGGRSENQDSLVFKLLPGDGLVVAVCDGMGGANGGAIASREAVDAMVRYLSEPHAEESGKEKVCSAVNAANDAVYQQALASPALRGMGTTATLALFDGDAAYVAHVGDSRIYQLRDGRKVFRTFDHSRVFELVRNKKITEEEARQRPDSNVIMRALGIRPHAEVDTERLSYRKGDRFVLCSDGIWGCMTEPELIRMMAARGGVKDVVESLVTAVDDIGKKHGGGHDNLTAVIVEMRENSIYKPSMLKRLTGKLIKGR